jgi:hypothetical protein
MCNLPDTQPSQKGRVMTYKGFLITLAMCGNRSTTLVQREGKGLYLWRIDPLFPMSNEGLMALAKRQIDGYLFILEKDSAVSINLATRYANE